MTIFLISDTHFGHANMYKFLDDKGERVRKEFKDAYEGDEVMIARWNAIVTPQDHVWVLGDFSCHSTEALARVGPRLLGHKRIVLGNHDIVDPKHWRGAGFQKVCGMHRLGAYWLTHAPLHPSHFNDRCRGNFHGHIHQRESPPGPYLNMSVERWNYTPVPLEVATAELERRSRGDFPSNSPLI